MGQNLEERAQDSEYKSKSEEIIAGYLKALGLKFKYEDRFCLKNERGLAKLFYPDFHLEDFGIVIEYLGLDDAEYLKQAERKRKLYEKQKVTVLQIKPEELWEQDREGKYNIKREFGRYLCDRINEKISERGQKPIDYGHIDTYLGADYARRAA